MTSRVSLHLVSHWWLQVRCNAVMSESFISEDELCTAGDAMYTTTPTVFAR